MTIRISMIAAMAQNRVIGADNAMPWHLPADLAHFKAVTLGKPVIMGRKTYQSIGKALPGRLNLVISRDPTFSLYDATVVANCDAAIQCAGSVDEVMVIGGGSIYEYFLPICDRLYLTHIDLSVDGDTFFPDYQSVGQWREIDSQTRPLDNKNPHNLRFVTLDKTK